MKRFIISLLIALPAFAMAQEKYPAYCDIFSFDGAGKCHVLVDFGEHSCGVLVDENKKEIEFGSLISALDYLVHRGWVLKFVYSKEAPVTFLGRNYSPHATHYILEKPVSSRKEIYEGIEIWYENKKSRNSMKAKKNQMTMYIDEVFRTAYSRQGMSYQPIEGDAYEHYELF